MESKVKLFGHPLHQMLIVFPLGLLAASIAFDITYLYTGTGRWLEISFWMITAGLIGGLVAAVPGFIDWLAIPPGTRAKAIGLWHGVGNVVVLALFLLSWLLRLRVLDQDWNVERHPGAATFVLSFVGIGLSLVTAWLGGELVDRLGIGVYNGAHADSPSSLSGRPATDRASRDRTWPAPGTGGRVTT